MVTNINNNIQFNYLEIIKNLDLKEKSELMIILAKEITDSALRKIVKKEEDIVYELAGSWKDDKTADELVSAIYSSRTINKKIMESLDD